MKKRTFLQPRITPVPLDAGREDSAGYEDRRYVQQQARGLRWLRFESTLENDYRRQSRSLWVRRGFGLALTGLTLFVGATAALSAQSIALALCVLMGWAALYLSAYHSRREFLVRGELQQQARLDGLTGAMNRRAFHQHLELIWRQAERDGTLVGLMLVDLDHFKALNDQHGHQAGDIVLRATTQILRSYALRPLDAVGRFGGDEFMVVWYDAQPGAFAQLVQLLPSKLWLGLAGIGLRNTDLTASGGAVLAKPGPDASIEQTFAAADAALYRIKRSRRGSIALEPGVLGAEVSTEQHRLEI